MSNPWSTPSTGPKVDFSEKYDPSVLKGRSAVVTGGSLGIGKGCVEGLAENGVYVTFVDINEEQGKATEKELKDKGLNVQFIKADVTSWEAIVGVFKSAVSFAPSETVDIVIPNAGIAGPPLGYWLAETPCNSISKDPLPPNRRVVDVNYLAVWNTVHAATYYFKNSTRKAEDTHSKLIIFVSSMGGYSAMPSVIDYNSSKWAVRGLFWSLRDVENILGEGKPKFRVNLIAPTWVRTNMTKRFQDNIENTESTFKMAEVSDVVDVVLRMASDENVKGRAAAIAKNKKSFDLCDNTFGLGVAESMTNPENLRALGYIPEEAPKTEDNGAKVEDNVPKAEGGAVQESQTIAVGIKESDTVVPEKLAPTALPESEPLAVKAIDAPADGPQEVVNVA